MKGGKDLTAILAASVLALMLSACSRRDKEPVSDIQVPIALSSDFAETDGTRTMVTDSDSLHKVGFAVYGYHDETGGNTRTEAFKNQTVTWNSTDSKWTYTPEKYWNQTAKYYFVAYSPRLDTTTNATALYVSNSYDSSTKKASLTVHNIPNWQKVDGNENDFMYAWSGNQTGLQYVKNTSYSATVHFKFNHLLARIIVKAYYEGTTGATPTALSLGSSTSKLPAIGGKLDWTYEYTTPTYTAPAPTLSASSVDILKGTGIALGTSSEGTVIADMLTVPFTTGSTAADQMSINISYEGKSGSASTGLVKFESGKIYTITLKVKTELAGDNVVVTGADIKDWQEIEGTGVLYNW